MVVMSFVQGQYIISLAVLSLFSMAWQLWQTHNRGNNESRREEIKTIHAYEKGARGWIIAHVFNAKTIWMVLFTRSFDLASLLLPLSVGM